MCCVCVCTWFRSGPNPRGGHHSRPNCICVRLYQRDERNRNERIPSIIVKPPPIYSLENNRLLRISICVIMFVVLNVLEHVSLSVDAAHRNQVRDVYIKANTHVGRRFNTSTFSDFVWANWASGCTLLVRQHIQRLHANERCRRQVISPTTPPLPPPPAHHPPPTTNPYHSAHMPAPPP